MIKEKYYFLEKKGSDVNIKYPTLWDGFLKYERKNNDPIEWLDLDNILIDICDINFYIHTDNDNIYLSVDRDESYYVHQFEKHIKKVIKLMEEKLDIIILEGSFNANEVKHNGSQYKYNISRDKDKIIVKKTILNWEIINKSRDEDDHLINKVSKIRINKN